MELMVALSSTNGTKTMEAPFIFRTQKYPNPAKERLKSLWEKKIMLVTGFVCISNNVLCPMKDNFYD